MNNALHNRDCPALMSDQRHATDYRPSCDVHHMILKQNNIKNSEQMRMFLQRNANKLRELNQDHYKANNKCNTCTYYHIDPNGHDKYWSKYKGELAFK